MRQFAQLDTGCPSKFGVQAKYVDRELHLVDDALAGRLQFAPKLKIFRRVIDFVSIFVVDILTFSQGPAEHFRHNKTMLEGFAPAKQVDSDISSRVEMPFRVDGPSFASSIPAIFAAKTLGHVVGRMLSVFGGHATPVAQFVAPFTFKFRWRSLVHEAWLSPFVGLVKEHG